MSLDVLYLSWNRWEFTEATLPLLWANTEWDLVRRFVVYDDGSEPPILAKLEALVASSPVEIDFRKTHHRSPVAVMRDYLTHEPASTFAKIDNDVAVPPGWLSDLLSVWADRIDLLGMELGQPHGLLAANGEPRRFVESSHIGGVGLMRTSAFERYPKMRPVGRFGFTEWQHTYRPVRGWIFPEVNAPCLDRLPTEPWVGLSERYESFGWQRPWWKYPAEASRYWEWMEVQCEQMP